MLLARFRLIHAAYERLRVINPKAAKLRLAPVSGIQTVHPEAAAIPAHCGMMLSLKSLGVFVETNSLSSAIESSTGGGKVLDPSKHISWEERTVLWALEDVATRIIQNEIRHHSRRSFARRQVSEGKPGVATVKGWASVPPAERILSSKPNEQDTAFSKQTGVGYSDGDKGHQHGGNRQSDRVDNGDEQGPRMGTADRARWDQLRSRNRGLMTSIPVSGLGFRTPNRTPRPSSLVATSAPSVDTFRATASPAMAVRGDDVCRESSVEAVLSSDLSNPDVTSTSVRQDPCKANGVGVDVDVNGGVDASAAAAFRSTVGTFVSGHGRTSEREKERLVAAGAGCGQEGTAHDDWILLPAEEQKKRLTNGL